MSVLLVVSLNCASCKEKTSTVLSVFPTRELAPTKFHLKADQLPAPFDTESASIPSRFIRPPQPTLNVPKGFAVNIFASGKFTKPRMLAVASNGDVFVSDVGAGKIIVLRDIDKNGDADERFTFAENLNQPFGLAFHGPYLYVANTNAVVRFAYVEAQTKATGAPEKILDLPGNGYHQHWTRNLVFSSDGGTLFVSVGSETNASVESDERRAAISAYDASRWNQHIFASGIRNPVGLAINPATQELWTAVNERDGLGDELVPDYVTSVKPNGFYGFPYAYIGKNRDPRHETYPKELVETSLVPDVLLQSHSAPIGLVFYSGAQFPVEYRNDAFVALHGSWNRKQLTGYKIVRIHFENGKPVGGYEDFITGWLPQEKSNEIWGRPAGLTVAQDGSLLICDDAAGTIWRVRYEPQ
jgi:glucose/arabinose dehydrogenase